MKNMLKAVGANCQTASVPKGFKQCAFPPATDEGLLYCKLPNGQHCYF